MQERTVEVIRRVTLTTSSALSESHKDNYSFEKFMERCDQYAAIIEDEFPESREIMMQTLNTYLIGYFEGISAANENLKSLNSRKKKEFRRIIDRMREADFSKAPKSTD